MALKSHARPAAVAEGAKRSAALIQRELDFWLLGGLSLLVWGYYFVAQHYRGLQSAADNQLNQAGAIAAALAIFVNYPHFMASYRIAYGRGWAFIKKAAFQTLVVPIGLVTLMGWGLVSYQQPLPELARTALNLPFTMLGGAERIGVNQTLGQTLFNLVLHLQVFTFGWHYAKQAYGCTMVYASIDRYPLDPSQRQAWKYLLFLVWAVDFFRRENTGSFKNYGVPNHMLQLPYSLSWFTVAFFVALLVFGYRVLYRNYLRFGVVPSANLLIPTASFIVWWMNPFFQYEFYFFIAPVFHSLQYLPFVFRIERGRAKLKQQATYFGARVILPLLVMGWLSWLFVPEWLDQRFDTYRTLSFGFFAIASNLILNVHHYFLDSAIWRFDNPEIKQHLLS